MALEDLAAIGTADATDHVRPRRKPIRKRIGGIIGSLRCGRIDYRNYLVNPLRKGSIEHHLLLAPWQRARQELFAVGGNGEMPREIARRDYCQEQEAQDHRPRIATRQLHQPCHRGYRHRVAVYLYGWSGDGSIARLNGNSLGAI